MSNLIYFRDNVLSKIKENKNLEEVTNWVRKFFPDSEEIKISIGWLSPKIKIGKYSFLTLINDRIKYNEEMIDKYLKLSFKEKQEAEDEINEESN